MRLSAKYLEIIPGWLSFLYNTLYTSGVYIMDESGRKKLSLDINKHGIYNFLYEAD